MTSLVLSWCWMCDTTHGTYVPCPPVTYSTTTTGAADALIFIASGQPKPPEPDGVLARLHR